MVLSCNSVCCVCGGILHCTASLNADNGRESFYREVYKSAVPAYYTFITNNSVTSEIQPYTDSKLQCLHTTHLSLIIQLPVKYNHTLTQNYISIFYSINQQIRGTRRQKRRCEASLNSSPHYQKS
jgi:hypothetical protein